MSNKTIVPGTAEDVRLAARLVLEGVVAEPTMRAVLAKQKELLERGAPLSAGEICRRKCWVSAAELAFLENVDRPVADLLPNLKIEGWLGQGGMSRVYRARDVTTQAVLAVKILHPRLRRRPESLQDFKLEAERLCSLDHENIVRGHYLHEHDGLVYMAMELVDGKSIQEHLDKVGRFSEDAALYIILQVARALTHLHDRGLVHRDIKPANILIDQSNTVKLCDVGLAIATGGGESEITAGTVQYIAPEQAQGQGGIDTRSDIYALGVTLFQLVVGKLPFEGTDDREALAMRLLAELDSPELKNLRISPHVHYFIQRMMALDREIRYQSPKDLIEDIEEQIRGKKSLQAQPGKVTSKNVELEKPFAATPFVRPPTGSSGPKRRPTR